MIMNSFNNICKSHLREAFFLKTKSDYLKLFLIPIILGCIIYPIIDDLIYSSAYDTQTSFFTLVCALIWVGLFNSIQVFCTRRETIKMRYYQERMSISGYVFSQFIFEMLICFILNHFMKE